MKVALFTDTYLPQVNGVSRTLARLVRHLAGGGHEVALVSPRIEAAPAEHVALHHRIRGVPIPVYPELLLTGPLGRRGRDALDDFAPDIVHCATESTVGRGGRQWALRRGHPLVTSFHTNFPEYAAGYGLGFAESFAWSLLRRFHDPALRTLCPSNATLEELRARGFHERLGIWSRGVDAELFDPAQRSTELRAHLAPDAEVILLYVGRLAPEKRIETLFEAFVLLRERTDRRVALVLTGDGPLGEKLRARDEAGVHFTGYLRGEALSAAYASADIFGFPSDTETFGNVVTEAMASGLPVVGADRGGVRDTIRHGETGFLIRPRDPEALAAALLQLVEDPALRDRMGRAARADALTRSWPAILDRVVDVYRDAVRGMGHGGSAGSATVVERTR